MQSQNVCFCLIYLKTVIVAIEEIAKATRE